MSRAHLVVGIAYLAVMSAAPAWATEAVTRDRIVAIVNDDVITARDLQAQASQLLQEANAPHPSTDQEHEQLRRAALEQLIERQLIVQEATRRGVKVSPEDVAKRLDEIRRQAATPEAYDAMLAEAGLTEEQFKSKLREQLLVQRAIEYQIRPKIQVSPTEIAKASSQSEASEAPGEEADALHLLVRVSEQRPEAAAKKLVEQLHQRLAGGEEFEPIAREYSESPDAQEGGRMGWVRHGELLPELDAALFALSPGQLSESVQTHLGFHLLKLVRRRTISDSDAAAARRNIEMRIYQQKFAEQVAAWLSELKEKAYIKIVE